MAWWSSVVWRPCSSFFVAAPLKMVQAPTKGCLFSPRVTEQLRFATERESITMRKLREPAKKRKGPGIVNLVIGIWVGYNLVTLDRVAYRKQGPKRKWTLI